MSTKDCRKDSYYMLEGMPCKVTETGDDIIAWKYIPSLGMVEISFVDVSFGGIPISKVTFEESVIKFSMSQGE